MKKLAISDIQAIAWDLDGTLIDSFDLYVKVAHKLALKFDFEKPEYDMMLKNYHGSLEDTLIKTFNINNDEVLLEVLTEFMIYQEDFYALETDSHFYEDAVALATEANTLGIKQIVVTNRAHEGRNSASPHHIIGKSRINEFIHEIRCRDQVEYPKPDSRVMHDWLVSHNLNPTKVLVIGDQHVDAQLAINMNSSAVLVDRNGGIPHIEDLLVANKDKILIVESLHDIKIN